MNSLLMEAFASAKPEVQNDENKDLVLGETIAFGSDALLEVEVEASLELAQIQVALDTAERAEASLEALYKFAESSLANGGMDSTCAMFFNKTYTNVLEQFGCAEEAALQLPSMESYDADGGRMRETEISMEAIKHNTLNVIWNTIRALLTRAAAAAERYWMQFKVRFANVEKRAAEIAGLKATGTPKERVVSFGSMSMLMQRNAVYRPTSLKQFMDLVRKLATDSEIEAVMDSYTKGLDEIKSAKDEEVKKGSLQMIAEQRARLTTILTGIFNATDVVPETEYQRIGVGLTKRGAKTESIYEKIVRTEPMVGNKAFYVHIPKEGSDAVAVFSLKDAEPMKTYKVDNLPALSLSEAKSTAAEAVELMGWVDKLITKAERLSKVDYRLRASADKVFSTIRGEEGQLKKGHSDVAKAVKDTQSISSLSRTPFIEAANYINQVAAALVKYAEVSISNLGEEKK